MAVPFNAWPQIPPNRQYYAMPPSSTPGLNYDGAIRSFTGYATSGDRRTMIEPLALKRFEEWGKIEGPRKIIMEVLRSRLDLGWPYNYKALDLLTVMPLTELVPLADQMRALADSSAGVEGGAELKKLAKPLYEKAMGEIRKGEEDEARRKQEAITAMWGGLWANEIGRPRAGGWYGRDYQAAYPWAGMSPGVAAQAEQQWAGRPPEGWQPSSISPIPQYAPLSRTGYYGSCPAYNRQLEPPGSPWWMSVTLVPPS